MIKRTNPMREEPFYKKHKEKDAKERQEDAQILSWTTTIVAWIITIGILGGIGYGVYWLGKFIWNL